MRMMLLVALPYGHTAESQRRDGATVRVRCLTLGTAFYKAAPAALHRPRDASSGWQTHILPARTERLVHARGAAVSQDGQSGRDSRGSGQGLYGVPRYHSHPTSTGKNTYTSSTSKQGRTRTHPPRNHDHYHVHVGCRVRGHRHVGNHAQVHSNGLHQPERE